jgi:hypothetical protein
MRFRRRVLPVFPAQAAALGRLQYIEGNHFHSYACPAVNTRHGIHIQDFFVILMGIFKQYDHVRQAGQAVITFRRIIMKKFFVFGLAFLFLGQALFADDAKVMPMRVGRLYMAPTFSFASGAYDDKGEMQSYGDGSVKLFNLGFALEYGVTDWITAAVQWVPGWTFWSDVKPAVPSPLNSLAKGDVTVNGVADIFAGAKIQVVGEKAPVESSTVRAAAAPGLIIPMPGPDFAKEVGKLFPVGTDKEVTFSSMDKHVFAAGARFYFDYIINSNFFINLYNETLFYPLNQDLNNDGPTFHATKMVVYQTIAADSSHPLNAAAGQVLNIKGEVNYKYRLTFEIEPVFSYPIADGVNFSAGLPVNYRYIPAYEYSFTFPSAISGAATAIEPQLLGSLKPNPQQSLYLTPNLSMFLTKTPLPLEFKFQYGIPVYGENVMNRNNITLQIRAYFRV